MFQGACSLTLRVVTIALAASSMACQFGSGASDAPPSSHASGDDGGSKSDADAGSDGGVPPAAPLGDGTCATDADCGHGEFCDQGVCDIQLCSAASYSSLPPLGPHRILEPFRDVVVVDDPTTLTAFDPTDGNGTGGAWTADAKVLDVAGGDFYGERPDAIALAVTGHQGVTMVRHGSLAGDIAVGFQPIAVAGGDVDADGVDEIVALGASGEIALCHAATGSCAPFALAGETGLDVTAADIDGDGYAEPVFLVSDANSASTLVVWNVDSSSTGQQKTVAATTSATLMRIAAGDLGASGVAVVLGLEDGGWADLVSDKLHVYDASGPQIQESSVQSVADDTTDLVAGVYDGGTHAGVLILEKSDAVQVVSPDLTIATSYAVATSTSTRIALADYAGNSPSATLQGDPHLVPGKLVPTSVLLYPPYSSQHSDGTSEILVGDSQSQSQTASDSVGLSTSIGAGFAVDIPDVVKASIVEQVTTSMTLTHTSMQQVTLANDYRVDARPDLSGPDNAAVILANACYHAYSYAIDDPQHKLGGNGQPMVLFVPVGGQETLWSLKRYDSLAQAHGDLPLIHVPYAVGDPTAFPAQPQTVEGQPIAGEDLVLSGKHGYRTSDVARVGWELTLADQQSTTQSTQVTDSAVGQVTVGPVVVQAETSGTLATSYSIALGQQAYFGGSVPPIKDDVGANGYSFAPIVYRAHDPTSASGSGGYFVVTYTVGP